MYFVIWRRSRRSIGLHSMISSNIQIDLFEYSLQTNKIHYSVSSFNIIALKKKTSRINKILYHTYIKKTRSNLLLHFFELIYMICWLSLCWAIWLSQFEVSMFLIELFHCSIFWLIDVGYLLVKRFFEYHRDGCSLENLFLVGDQLTHKSRIRPDLRPVSEIQHRKC